MLLAAARPAIFAQTPERSAWVEAMFTADRFAGEGRFSMPNGPFSPLWIWRAAWSPT